MNDIANGALLKIGVRDHNEAADASSADIALDAYNGIMAEQAAHGWISSFTAQALSEDIPIGAQYVEPLKAAVAVRIAGSFGAQVTPRVANEATLFDAMLAAAYWDGKAQTFERGIRFEPADSEWNA